MAVAAQTFFVAHRLRHRLAERDADVFHRMVGVDVQIAFGNHLDINHAITYDLVEHMIEEGHAGLKFGRAGAVEVDLHLDTRLQRIALHADYALNHGVSPGSRTGECT